MLDMRYPALGVVLPIVLGMFAAADVALRFLAPEIVVRPLESAAQVDPAPRAPFRAMFHAASSEAFGIMAYEGNLSTPRDYHAETFSTDRWGFRNEDRELEN